MRWFPARVANNADVPITPKQVDRGPGWYALQGKNMASLGILSLICSEVSDHEMKESGVGQSGTTNKHHLHDKSLGIYVFQCEIFGSRPKLNSFRDHGVLRKDPSGLPGSA
jgi:hypothetical protein